MPRTKMLIEVRKNGDYFLKAPVDELVDYFESWASFISHKAATGGVIDFHGDKYMLRYTDETVPRRVPLNDQKPKPTKKPKIPVKDVVAAARKAGLSYGQSVAMMEGSKQWS